MCDACGFLTPWMLMAGLLLLAVVGFVGSLRAVRRRETFADVAERRRFDRALERACRD